MEQPKPVGIWIRVSTEDQAKGESPEHHEQRARLYAEAKGWEVKTIYHLEAVSGKSVIEHPEAKRMVADIKKGFITGLVFSKLARLTRNTRELLDFSDMFRIYNADLISLQESIDTSTPAGRMFYTTIAAMAQWEREEIGSRVAASIPIRAKLGKQISGQPPFGYRWENKQLVIDEKEAPVRKLMYELFIEHKRKQLVAKLLNERGYRTRNGSKFTDVTIHRLLLDPIAKGVRRANYTQTPTNSNSGRYKPETDWIILPCPAIISEEMWNKCMEIQAGITSSRMPRSKVPTHIFSGFIRCECGSKMYVASRTQRYRCSGCKKTRIEASDIEEIYYEHLKSFLLSKEDLQTFKSRANEEIQSRQTELNLLTKEKERLKEEMKNLLTLHRSGQIPTKGFKEFYDPLDVQCNQIESTITEVQSQLDLLTINASNGELILENAENLYERWPTLTFHAKRQIVEELTQSITIGDEDITIKFAYAPAPIQNAPKSQRTDGSSAITRAIHRLSCWPR